MRSRDDLGDRLADDALLAIMRLLVHQEGGQVEVDLPDGGRVGAFDAHNLGMVEHAVSRYWRALNRHRAAEEPERMVLQSEIEGLRLQLDGQWNVVILTLPVLAREADRRSVPDEAGLEGIPPTLD